MDVIKNELNQIKMTKTHKARRLSKQEQVSLTKDRGLVKYKITALRPSRQGVFEKNDKGFGIVSYAKSRMKIHWENGSSNVVRWPILNTWYEMIPVEVSHLQKLSRLQRKIFIFIQPIFNSERVSSIIASYIGPNFGLTAKLHKKSITTVAIASDDSFVISGSKDSILIQWNMYSGKKMKDFIGHENAVRCTALSNDDTLLVSGSDDNTIKIWDVRNGRHIRTLSGHEQNVMGCCLTYDDRFIISGSADTTAKIWNMATGSVVFNLIGHQHTVHAIAVAHDNSYVVTASADRTMRMWAVSTGKSLNQYIGHQRAVSCVAITKDDLFIISGSFDKTCRIWNRGGNMLRKFEGHVGMIYCLDVSHDNAFVITGGDDKTVRVWTWEGVQIRILNEDTMNHTISGCKISSDDSFFVSGGDEKLISIWEGKYSAEKSAIRSLFRQTSKSFRKQITIQSAEDLFGAD